MQYYFEDTLTAKDVKRHLAHTFEVPAHSGQLDIRLNFRPGQVGSTKNMLTLTLFDPVGFRGTGHRGGDTHQVRLSATGATPGYRPGPLPTGQWTVQLDTHLIMPDEPCRYQLFITIQTDRQSSQTISEPKIIRSNVASRPGRGAGRYRGDLHAHSVHSDGEWTGVELIEAARKSGLDFITLTDHNTVTGLVEMDQLSSPELLALGGIELTTFWGHALCLGARHWIDWRVGPHRTMADIARKILADDQLFIIAHPCHDGDPICTGCNWGYVEMMPGVSQHLEIWNNAWDNANNEQALALWYRWLNQGHRLVATSGSDAHNLHEFDKAACNVVYADALSEPAIFQAIKQGHLYLSTGPVLEFTARADDKGEAIVGDTLSGRAATLTVEWAECPAKARLRIIVDGKLFAERPGNRQGAYTWTLPADRAHWCVVELRRADGEMLAVTNPIYLGS